MGGLGGILNSITGASSSARQQNQYAVGMANLNFNQQKEMLLNGPSWQMEGYEKAGLNPALGHAAGSLNTGGAGGNSTGGPGAGATLGALATISDMYNNTMATNADTNLKNAEAMRIIEMLPFDKDEKLKMIQKLGTGASLDIASAKYHERRASGKGHSAKIGGYGFNAGYSIND